MDLNVLIFLFEFAAAAVSVYLFFSFGKGALRLPFIGITSSIVLLFLSTAFVFVADKGYITVSEINLHLLWHLIFIFSMISFIMGGKKLSDLARSPESGSQLLIGDVFFPSLFLALSVSFFLVAGSIDSAMTSMFAGSFVDSFGLHHILAVIAALAAAWYVLDIKNSWGSILSVGVYPFFAFLALLGLQHGWELITESWKIITVSHETIETVEQFIVLPAVVALIIGLYGVLVSTKTSRGK